MKLTLLSTTAKALLAAALAAVVLGIAAPESAGAQTPGTVSVLEATGGVTLSTPQGPCRAQMPTHAAQVSDGSFFATQIGTTHDCSGFHLMRFFTYRDVDSGSGTPTAVEVVATTMLRRTSDNTLCAWTHTPTRLSNFRWAPGPGGIPLPQTTASPAVTLQGCGASVTFRYSFMHP